MSVTKPESATDRAREIVNKLKDCHEAEGGVAWEPIHSIIAAAMEEEDTLREQLSKETERANACEDMERQASEYAESLKKQLAENSAECERLKALNDLLRGDRDMSNYSYGIAEHKKKKGNGENHLRTELCSMPRALRKGDVISTGDEILSDPRDGYNGLVNLHLTGGFDGHWIGVAGRLPIALMAGEEKLQALQTENAELRQRVEKAEQHRDAIMTLLRCISTDYECDIYIPVPISGEKGPHSNHCRCCRAAVLLSNMEANL